VKVEIELPEDDCVRVDLMREEMRAAGTERMMAVWADMKRRGGSCSDTPTDDMLVCRLAYIGLVFMARSGQPEEDGRG
jgi:hypothetical protein